MTFESDSEFVYMDNSTISGVMGKGNVSSS